MKPKAGTEVFELIPSQKMINFMLKYSFFHKQVIQIPMSIVTSTPIDFDVLKKALNIEIERNDCMRLRFYKEHGEFYQYFLDKYVVDDVPVVTFSTEEEQQAYLTADARRPIRHLKGEDFRIIFFRSFDGGYGIYINITHLCMDAAAVFVFFSDLLGVYDHLKNGKPMPRPLGEYKKTIRKELAIVADEKKMKEEEEFYTQFFLKDGDPLYADGMIPFWIVESASDAAGPKHSVCCGYAVVKDGATELRLYDPAAMAFGEVLAAVPAPVRSVTAVTFPDSDIQDRIYMLCDLGDGGSRVQVYDRAAKSLDIFSGTVYCTEIVLVR
ncbi:MAG: DUF4784 domain-containing protein [Ruminococcaceae bacterium]|nr:DUF4784 domain-containing protein [Oscillospiraceae bacterium]